MLATRQVQIIVLKQTKIQCGKRSDESKLHEIWHCMVDPNSEKK